MPIVHTHTGVGEFEEFVANFGAPTAGTTATTTATTDTAGFAAESWETCYAGARGSAGIKRTPAQEQRHKAVTVLSKIQNDIDEHAIIAGGAPRNWHVNKKARDVDIYIPLRSFSPISTIDHLLKILKVNPRKVLSKSASSAKHHRNIGIPALDIADVIGFTIDDIEYDIIFYRSAELNGTKAVLDSFDVNICKVYIDNRGRDILTDEARADFENETITCNIASQDVKGMKVFQETRYPKLKEAFPTFEFVGMLRNKGEVI